MSQAAELLCYAVLEYEDVIEFESRIVVAIGVQRHNRQAHFFSKNPNRLILAFVDWRFGLLLGRRMAGSEYDYKKRERKFKAVHRLHRCAARSVGFPRLRLHGRNRDRID